MGYLIDIEYMAVPPERKNLERMHHQGVCGYVESIPAETLTMWEVICSIVEKPQIISARATKL